MVYGIVLQFSLNLFKTNSSFNLIYHYYLNVVITCLLQYLSKALERVQKRALRIIFGPDLSYEDTLVRAGPLSLEAIRHQWRA